MKNQDNFYYDYESDAFFDRWQNKNTKFKKLRPHTKKTVDFISHHIDCDSISILEIGCFEGASTCYLVENISRKKKIEIHCIDNWKGGLEHRHDGFEVFGAVFCL